MTDFESGARFQRVIPESFPEDIKAPADVRKVVLCSGKIYYELLALRQKESVDDVAIVRFEQVFIYLFKWFV